MPFHLGLLFGSVSMPLPVLVMGGLPGPKRRSERAEAGEPGSCRSGQLGDKCNRHDPAVPLFPYFASASLFSSVRSSSARQQLQSRHQSFLCISTPSHFKGKIIAQQHGRPGRPVTLLCGTWQEWRQHHRGNGTDKPACFHHLSREGQSRHFPEGLSLPNFGAGHSAAAC